jgi:hypothetical protein
LQKSSYNTGPSVRAGGTATVQNLSGGSGALNFTELDGDTRPLCGAGTFDGARTGQQLTASFVSRNLDQGCGFDHGGIFTITATVGLDERWMAGDYQATNAGGSALTEAPGLFEVWGEGEAPATVPYAGWFFNQQAGISGTLTLDLASGERVIFGKMNFSGQPGGTTLCGAGTLTGARGIDNRLEWSFVSPDTDPGCGFDRGLRFVIETERASEGVLSGIYYLGSTRAGIFEVRAVQQLWLPLLQR